MTDWSTSSDAERILSDLVSFDTTSRESNDALIAYVEAMLEPLGAATRRVPSADGRKSSLIATIGPEREGGVVLSGHTDVVPVDDQKWSTDPFEMVGRGGKLFGRGTADMKGFLACCLAAAPNFARPGALKRPVHLAFSYDEEVGCLGAPAMIDVIRSSCRKPVAVIVGEPTSMTVVSAHKGIVVYEVTVRGREAHSSLTHLGVSANMLAVRAMHVLLEIGQALEAGTASDSPFEPRHATLTIGRIHGGTAINILSGACVFAFDLRCPPGIDPDVLLRPFFAEVQRINNETRASFPHAGIEIIQQAAVPAFFSNPVGPASSLARRLTGDNADVRVVPYGSEAGQFQTAGFSTVICGPGSIEQAHQPDEYIEREQIGRCMILMQRLSEHLNGDGTIGAHAGVAT